MRRTHVSRRLLGPILVPLVLAFAIPLLADAERGDGPLLTALRKLLRFDGTIRDHAHTALEEGRDTFRFDTFGDEIFWGDTLQLHRAIVGARQGGVGPGLSPAAALGLGLKVDVDALPRKLQAQLQAKKVPLDDPAVTLQLLRLNAVVGVKGFFTDGGGIERIGITCALCHSQVDDAVAPGIGHRLDGWANRDLNVGAIIAFAPNLQPFVDLLRIVIPDITQETVRTVLTSWGPGKFDAALALDGKAVQPNGTSAATLIPPAFGLAGVNLHTWTGWGSVTHWNAFVANLEMHGQGTFVDPRLNDAAKFPIAQAFGFGNVRSVPDLITPKLPALHFYQLAIPAPAPPAGSFDPAAAARGAVVFSGKADCARCHVPPLFTEPGWNMHTPEELGIDGFQASRAPDGRYRTAPLRGLWTHLKGGFYHDGRFKTLADVVEHYNSFFGLALTAEEQQDLIEYLKSL
jgi:cytochrome c2